MRILLVTPYAPQEQHDHAANDIARPFCQALGELAELFVYAPGSPYLPPSDERSYTVLAARGTRPRRRWRRFSLYPSMLRELWQADHRREVARYARSLRPDVLHVEYLYPHEALRVRAAVRLRSATFHDISTLMARKQVELADKLLRRVTARWDLFTVARLERQTLKRMDRAFAFSSADVHWLESKGARATQVNLGIGAASSKWDYPAARRVLFFGALWRDANQLSLRFILNEVMPKVWAFDPSVTFVVAGARPPAWLLGVATDPRIELRADVDDVDSLFASCTCAIAPSVLPAGILLKVLRGMAVGLPQVMNANSSQPVEGYENFVHGVAARDAAGLAEGIITLLSDRELAESISAAAAELVQSRYSWDACADLYVATLERDLDESATDRQA